jgi:hypothetical protein
MGLLPKNHLRKRGLFDYLISAAALAKNVRAIRHIDRGVSDRCAHASLLESNSAGTVGIQPMHDMTAISSSPSPTDLLRSARGDEGDSRAGLRFSGIAAAVLFRFKKSSDFLAR